MSIALKHDTDLMLLMRNPQGLRTTVLFTNRAVRNLLQGFRSGNIYRGVKGLANTGITINIYIYEQLYHGGTKN